MTGFPPLNQRLTLKMRPPGTRSPVVPTTTTWSGPSFAIVGSNMGLHADAAAGSIQSRTRRSDTEARSRRPRVIRMAPRAVMRRGHGRGRSSPDGNLPRGRAERSSSGRLVRSSMTNEALGRRPDRTLDPGPRTAADEDRGHPCGGCRDHVVVDTVADVGDGLRRQRELGGDPGEERGRRLLDAPAAEVATRSSSMPTVARISAARSGWLPGDPDAEPEPAQLLQTRAERRGRDLRREGRSVSEPRSPSCPSRWSRYAEDIEDLLVVPTFGDQATEHGQKGESWHAGPIRPGRPLARLIDQRLAEVEDDRLEACRRIDRRCSPRRFWRPIPIERQRQPLLAGHRGESRCLSRQLHEGRLRDGVAGAERREPDLAQLEVRPLEHPIRIVHEDAVLPAEVDVDRVQAPPRRNRPSACRPAGRSRSAANRTGRARSRPGWRAGRRPGASRRGRGSRPGTRTGTPRAGRRHRRRAGPSPRRPRHDPDRARATSLERPAFVGLRRSAPPAPSGIAPPSARPGRSTAGAGRSPRSHRATRTGAARSAIRSTDGRRPRASSNSSRSGSAGNGTRSSPWTGGQNGFAAAAGTCSIRTATHSRPAAASRASTNGPIASTS